MEHTPIFKCAAEFLFTPMFCVSTARVSTFYNTKQDFDKAAPAMATI
jgi:hypothetical protein